MNPDDYRFKDRKEETLIKSGTINGNGFVLENLHDCEVYVLDHFSQVQVDDCVGCRIFLGPTDGSVFIRDCRDCDIAVASRQLRTRDCKDLRISLYCATQPSIETSTGITFSCWRGAYPGLGEHFKRARLDPAKNNWTQVYDFNSKDDLGAPHYSLDESVHPWWVAPPQSGDYGPPDCPVPAPDGSLFGGGRTEPPPKSPGSGLPDSLPPSPGRAAAHDEEVELEDDEEGAHLPPDHDDGGMHFIPPAVPSPRPELHDSEEAGSSGGAAAAAAAAEAAAVPSAAAGPSFSFGSPPQNVPVIDGGGAPAVVPTLAAPPSFRDRTTGGLMVGEGPPAAAEPIDLAVISDGGAADPTSPPPPPVVQPAAPLPPPVADDPPPPAPELDSDFFAPYTPAAPAVQPAAAESAAAAAEVDARVAWRAGNARQLAEADRKEEAAKAAVVAEARKKLEAIQASRAALLKQRFATNRSSAAASAGPGGASKGPAGASKEHGWARVGELVDLTGASHSSKPAPGSAAAAAAGPSKDVSRLRGLIISLKSAKLGGAK